MKAVQEDEELLCIVWAKTGDVSGHTILRYGSTHSYIAPSLAWDIHCGPVSNNITATSSALGQVEASFIHKHKDSDTESLRCLHHVLCFCSVLVLILLLPAPHAEETPRPVLSVSPQSWVTEGDSVTLICEVKNSSTDWTFSWYREVPYRENNVNTTYKDSSRGFRGSYTFSPAALKQTGVYTCKAERHGQTIHSNSQALWITGESPPVSMIINPSRTQHFTYDSLSLSCEDQSHSTGWTVRRYTDSGGVTDCLGLGSVTGSTCTISSIKKPYTGVYWCESESGETSNPVNITVDDRYVLLESPVHPVTEEYPLTLRCLDRYTKSSTLEADFYKDGSVLQTQTTGEMIIHKVSKTDEGFYHCKYPVRGESLKSWVSVRRKKSGKAPFSVLMLICSVVTPVPYLLVTIILLIKCYRARAQTDKKRIENAVVEE
ncbi:uncharacterized protein LOC128514982 [Clarias gariepinus]|uniref:uncharacterized protein LOC128514982 n=1 Tax=Clarias gariepinus TaxID=13013 RepID=UPI00234C5F2E|nr:uncharacterized protein LOC128514982 [Clarias gariepinus]